MSRFLKKRVPAFLITLVMVTTLIPMTSAKSSADIEYEVDAGDNVTLEFSDFQNYYDKYESDNLYRMEFTDLTDVDSNGRMYAVDFEGDEVRVNEDNLYNSWFYASKSDVQDSGKYRIKGMNYSAGSNADGETAELAFTLYGDKKGELKGILRIYIGSSGSSKSGTISYSVKSGEEVAFDEDDFQKLYDDSSCTGTFKYVEFDRPSTSEYANGTIYSRYNTRKEVAFSRSDFRGTTFGYSDYADGDYDLSDLSFVADKAFTSGSITLSFTLYGGTGSRTNQSATGTLKITASKSGSSSTSKGDITYTVKAGEEVAFDEDDFQKLYDKSSCTGTFKYLVFDRPSTSEYANGTIYSRYGKRNETAFSRSALNGNTFGYSDYADGDYDLSNLSFVADKAFTSGSITLSFTLYGGTGSRTNQSTTGTLKITSGKSSSTTSKGDITYTVKAGSEVSFDEDDFQKLYDKSSCTGTFKYLAFDRPSTDYTSAGAIYSRYGKRNETSFSRSALNGNSFGYSDYADGDYDLSDLSFVADKSFSGSITLSFTLYGGTGSRTNQSTTGTLVITSGNSGSSRSYYVGNIRYSVTPGTALQINPNDIARYFKKCSGGNLMYVTLTSLPTAGSLYYNYYGTSQYGASSRTQMTAASAAGRMFAYSPSAKTEYALSELTYIPSGANYCTAIGFTAYGGNGQSYTGSILISVSTQAVPEIYSVTTKGTSVSFPATAISSAVSGATGASFSSIQLLDLPATTSGVVYYGSSVANTTSQYAYANLSQLRFVPNSNFTGSVSIPYVALNSRGTAMAMGQFSIGVVSSVKKFSDVATTTWCYKYVTELSSANIISGYSNGSFQEKNTITYGAALKLIMLAAGYGEQAPTVKGSTFSGYLAKAKADGLVTGNPKLNGSITRLQIAQIASKALKLSTTNLSNKKPFTDTNDVYVQALNAAGIIEGYFSNGTSTYKPNSTLTRGQVSAIVWRMRNYEK